MDGCIEELALEHYIAVVAQMCWERAIDEEDGWESMWPSWDEYQDDHRPLARLLVSDARMWLTGGVPFFVPSPQQPSGDSGS